MTSCYTCTYIVVLYLKEKVEYLQYSERFRWDGYLRGVPRTQDGGYIQNENGLNTVTRLIVFISTTTPFLNSSVLLRTI